MAFGLKQLQYFVAVAEELHFGRAAARLRISQPPLSQQIKRLENDLDVHLFHRTNRTVRLTEAGEFLLREIRPILTSLENVITRTRCISSGQAGYLSIAFVISATYTILPLIIRAFMERYPDITLELQEMRIEDQLDALLSDKIHLGIIRLPVRNSSIRTEILHKESLVLALPADHPLATKKRISLKELAPIPFVMAPRHSGGFYDFITRLCRDAGFEPIVRKEATDMQAVIGLVSVGLGVTLVPEINKQSPVKNVVYRHLRENPSTELAIACRRDNLSPAVQAFFDIARQTTEA